MSKEIDEIGKFAIEIERHLLHFWRIGPNLMAQNVVGREADGKQIRRWTATHVFVRHQFSGEFEFVFIGECGGPDYFVEASFGSVFALAVCGGAKSLALRVLPLPIPILRRVSGVEILQPFRKVVAVVRGGYPRATLWFDPVGCVSRKACGKDGGTVFQ